MLELRATTPSSLTQTPLVEEARKEGFLFLDRLLMSVKASARPFTATSEAFLGAYINAELIAVGGISRDPYGATTSTGRLRHLYVRRRWRGRDVGRNLIDALIVHSKAHFRAIRLWTDTDSASAFYDSIGFCRTNEPNATHRFEF